METLICNSCLTENDSSNIICQQCGQDLSEQVLGDEDESKLKVLHAITYQLERHPQVEVLGFSIKAGQPWDLSNNSAKDFISKIENKFRRKNKLHGFISDDSEDGIASYLSGYIEKKIDFVTFVEYVMRSFLFEADELKQSNLRGGNVVFIHYATHEDDDIGRMLVVMVDKKGVFDFDDELRPKKLESIDTDALRQAAMFDLTLFDVSYPENNGEAYLRFIEGKSTSNFFKSALGCGASIDNKTSVDEVGRAVREFATRIRASRDLRDKMTCVVDDYMESCASIRKSVTIDNIQHEIDKCIPDGVEGRGLFAEFANLSEYKINEYFEPTISSVKASSSILISDDNNNFTCKIKRSSIGGESSSKPVKLVDSGRYLLIPVEGQLKEEEIKLLTSE